LIGWLWLAIFTLTCGSVRDHIAFDELRPLAGIGLSIMMPNVAALLAGAWPDTKYRRDQSRKMLAFCVFDTITPDGYVLSAAWGAAITETGLLWGWIY